MIGFRNANTKTTVAAMAVALNAGKVSKNFRLLLVMHPTLAEV